MSKDNGSGFLNSLAIYDENMINTVISLEKSSSGIDQETLSAYITGGLRAMYP